MHDLVVVRFHGLKSAATVLSELLQLTYDGKLDLFDAVAAYRTDDGVLRIDESVLTTLRTSSYRTSSAMNQPR
jgi:uncharacterized membrane protein